LSKTAIVTFSAALQGDANYQTVQPTSYTFTDSPFEHTQSTLNIGGTFVTIPTLPSQARYVRILPPAGSTITKTIYLDTAGSNGWVIDPANETWLSIPLTIAAGGAPTFLYIVATGAEAVDFYWY